MLPTSQGLWLCLHSSYDGRAGVALGRVHTPVAMRFSDSRSDLGPPSLQPPLSSLENKGETHRPPGGGGVT